MKLNLEELNRKACSAREQTLLLHKRAPQTRLASSLSDIEIFTVLYYTDILIYNVSQPLSQDRDRFIVSKGHGGVSLYPILSDLDFFPKDELDRIGREDSFLGVIPDTLVPGFETINGSLGHGLGVACGVALALKRKKIDRFVFVLCGDGELNSGSIWEAVMLASFARLSNLILIVDNNKMSMLGYQKDILGLEPLEDKFASFSWKAKRVDGHNIEQLYNSLRGFKKDKDNKPKVLIADTCKGKGVSALEKDSLCHIRTLSPDCIDKIIKKAKDV